MTFQKGSIFVVAISVLLTNVNPVRAMEAKSDLSQQSSYDFKKDPLLLDWTSLVAGKQSALTAEAPMSFEEKTLESWKQKQGSLWAGLPKAKFIINASAYTAAADECGKNDGITASGLKVAEKRTLACPPAFPFGTKINIDGVGELRCEDRGGAIKGNHFDIYVQTKTEAFAFGRRNLVAEVVE